MVITLMFQVGTFGSFHPVIIRSKIKQNTNTLNIIINMFSGFNWLIKLTKDCYLYFLNYVRPLPKNVKAILVPRETLFGFCRVV